MAKWFQDLAWRDVNDNSRLVFVRRRDDRKHHKWDVVEDSRQGGEIVLTTTVGLSTAVERALVEANWMQWK